ncbi:MAG TPA: methyltransferase domain-containing protein [Armatimonadetes bacterium]|nr:methyltransferase domain-containing protein [Armatimonadota bacterium]
MVLSTAKTAQSTGSASPDLSRRPEGGQQGGRWTCSAKGVAHAILVMLTMLVLTGTYAADWPTYLHDNVRSGVTSEQLNLPLSLEWAFVAKYSPVPAWEGPKPAPVEGILEVPRVRFDDAFQVAVVGGLLYFGSSADHRVYCLEVSTGTVRWTFLTEGPVRLAPTVWQGRVFVGSDDGFVYCLNAAKGTLLWKFQAAPRDERVLGNGKMISLWPVRTGVLVDDGVAYFGAGIFPAEGVYLYAVRAEDGRLIWKNDSWGYAGGWQSRSPQGYLLAGANRLYVPCGRALPAAFDRKDGHFLYQHYPGWRSAGVVGGTYALLAGDHLYSGSNVIPAYEQSTGKIGFAWFPGRRLIVTRNFSYLLTDREMLALDRTTYPEASRKRKALEGRRRSLESNRSSLRRNADSLRRRINEIRADLAALDKQLEELRQAPRGEMEELTALRKGRETLNTRLKAAEEELEAVTKQLSEVEEQLKAVREEQKQTEENVVRPTIKWRRPSECPDALILAGGVLFAGGPNKVMAVDATTGEELWHGEVSGRTVGLAAAGGRLFASTDRGAIYCFRPGRPSAAKYLLERVDPEPYPQDRLSPVYEAVAERIVRETGVTKGYCLVLGCGTGRLALELAKRTDLIIYGIEPDGGKVERAKAALEAAGLYGARVTVERGSLSDLPYSDYFANLIVSDDLLVSGRLRGSAKELFRVLKPCGGVAYLGQPEQTVRFWRRLKAESLRRWLTEGGIREFEISAEGGVWAKIVRGPLPGAGSWTHQYANPGNTACSDDRIVRPPLGVLWFGQPGPAKMLSRHAAAAGPLSVNGRFFVQGENVVMAYDAYNGLKLWEREIRGAMRAGMPRECSNLAANEDSLFVAVGDRCLRLDAATGETRMTYTLPPSPDGKPRSWGYVAVVGELLFGSATPRNITSDLLFAVDVNTGQHRWVHRGKTIAHNTIAIGGGRVFFTEKGITSEQRQEALRERTEKLKGLKGLEALEAKKQLARAEVRLAVALDAHSGKVIWQRPLDLTDCGGSTLATIYQDDILLFCGAFQNGHFWREFHAGELAPRRITALSARDGELLWSRALGYRTRPLVNGNTIYADPWAFDLRSGEQIMRVHPVTGEKVPWEFGRGHHCGPASGSRYCLFFRSLTSAYYDLLRDSGVLHFGGHRPGCYINMIAANGLLLEPEASSGCQCLFSLYSTVVFKPRETDRAWGRFCSQAPVTPVRHLALNLGAPGDRRDREGTLWLAYPRPGLPLVLRLNLPATILSGLGYFRFNPEGMRIAGTDKPWVFSSGCCGLSKFVIPLIEKGQEPGVYTVRLDFAELTDNYPGQRVFDVKLQGQVVLEGFDILREAGARNRAIVKEFKGLEVTDNLTVEFVPRVENPTKKQAPLICGIEVLRETP